MGTPKRKYLLLYKMSSPAPRKEVLLQPKKRIPSVSSRGVLYNARTNTSAAITLRRTLVRRKVRVRATVCIARLTSFA